MHVWGDFLGSVEGGEVNALLKMFLAVLDEPDNKKFVAGLVLLVLCVGVPLLAGAWILGCLRWLCGE